MVDRSMFDFVEDNVLQNHRMLIEESKFSMLDHNVEFIREEIASMLIVDTSQSLHVNTHVILDESSYHSERSNHFDPIVRDVNHREIFPIHVTIINLITRGRNDLR